MKSLDSHKTGLGLASFGVVVHLIWSLCVAVIPALVQKYIDWMFVLHHVRPVYQLLPFNVLSAGLLLIVVFVTFYAIGQVFARVWNYWA